MISAAMFSGGKESVYAACKALRNNLKVKYFIHGHFEFPRPSAHTLNIEFVRKEAEVIGIPLVEVKLRKGFEFKSLRELLVNLNVDSLVAGDLYLIDHYNWVERLCEAAGLKCIEPLWIGDQSKSRETLIEEVNSGIEAIICGVDLDKIDSEWIGRVINRNLVNEFLDYCSERNIDPCGEQGEYHTLVYSSPIHREKIRILDCETLTTNNYRYLKVKRFNVSNQTCIDTNP